MHRTHKKERLDTAEVAMRCLLKPLSCVFILASMICHLFYIFLHVRFLDVLSVQYIFMFHLLCELCLSQRCLQLAVTNFWSSCHVPRDSAIQRVHRLLLCIFELSPFWCMHSCTCWCLRLVVAVLAQNRAFLLLGFVLHRCLSLDSEGILFDLVSWYFSYARTEMPPHCDLSCVQLWLLYIATSL